jgi:F420H(2)-dependent quinone reductase
MPRPALRTAADAERGTARSEGQAVGLPWAVVRIANAVTNLALLAGMPRSPYNRGNALIVETRGRRSGKRRRMPVGYLDDGGRIIVVVEGGSHAHWVRNALAFGGRLRMFFRVHGDRPGFKSSTRIRSRTSRA